MITLSNLPKLVTQKKQRVGRGNGSNRGKNAGKGNKGQTKRGHVPIFFAGRQSDAGSGIMARSPKLKGFTAWDTKSHKVLYIERIVSTLESGATINLATLLKAGLVTDKIKTVKIIKGNSETTTLENPLKFDETKNVILSKGVKELLK